MTNWRLLWYLAIGLSFCVVAEASRAEGRESAGASGVDEDDRTTQDERVGAWVIGTFLWPILIVFSVRALWRLRRRGRS